jgi:hypothetical protein
MKRYENRMSLCDCQVIVYDEHHAIEINFKTPEKASDFAVFLLQSGCLKDIDYFLTEKP